MKKSILTFLAIISCSYIFAQFPVYNTLFADFKDGAYYKDATNELNKFEGRWLYTNGNTSFELILQKRIMQKRGKYYCDLLVGGYKYVENGVVKVDWLNDVNIVYSQIYLHKVKGSHFLTSNQFPPVCNDCDPNERRLDVSIAEPHAVGRSYAFRYKTNVGSPDQIIIQPSGRDMIVTSPGDPPKYYSLPFVLDFTLTKQP